MTINNSNISSYFRKFKRLAYSKNANEKELKEMMKNLIEYYKEKFGVSDENAYSMLFADLCFCSPAYIIY